MKVISAGEGDYCKVVVDHQPRIYQYSEGGWIQKRYFSRKDVASILKVRKTTLSGWVQAFGMPSMTYREVLKFIEIRNYREDGLSIKEIKERI